MLVEIKMYNDDTRRIYFVKELVEIGVDEDNDWAENTTEPFTTGFYCDEEQRWYADWEDLESFTVIENYEELGSITDFYGVGLDKIVANIDGETCDLVSSRWQDDCHYMTYATNNVDI